MSVPNLFDEAVYAQRQGRCAQPTLLQQTLSDTIADRIADVARRFNHVWTIDHQQRDNRTLQLLNGDVAIADKPDLITVSGLLHTTNDVPGLLLRIKNILIPDGFFVASLPGGDTLTELRQCLIAAEAHIRGGAAQRVHPMLDVRAAGALLQRAGFALPVAEVDRYTLTYPSMLHLLREVQAMGETNCLVGRAKQPLNHTILIEAERRYLESFGLPDGKVAATLSIITMTGWAPAPDQPQARPRGSARVSLVDALARRGP